MNRIAALRKERKLNQKQLGSILGVAQNTICNWENGKRDPDYESLKKMALFFNCSTDYLLGIVMQSESDDEKPAPADGDGPDETAKRFMDLVDKLTPDQQQLLLAQLQAWTEQNQRQAPAAPPASGEKFPESAL